MSKEIAESIRRRLKEKQESHSYDCMCDQCMSDDFLSQDADFEEFPDMPYDNEIEAEEIPSQDNNKKKRVAMIMGKKRMGAMKGRAGKEDKY